MTLRDDSMARWEGRLSAVSARLGTDFPGEGPERQPVHTVYGGAHLFTANTASRLGELALAALDRWVPAASDLASILRLPEDLAPRVHALVRAKLEREPVEDFRIDFEDGYGHRPDEEEDGQARAAALELANGMKTGSLPPFTGIRIKSLSAELHRRALRTLDLFVTAAVEEGGGLPPGFTVTLPKIQDPEQVVVLAEALKELEEGLGIEPIPIELMVETPQTIIDRDGTTGIRKFVDAAAGRVRGAHFGTYDYTASLTITAAYQTMTHPACDFARHALQVGLASTGVWISDGATNVMPVPPHRGEGLTAAQVEENATTVHEAMRLHYDHVRHSLTHAYYQGWDLHPAQFPTRYAAVYAFFLEGLDQAGARLSNFVESAAKATLVGEVFDDAATGQGLLNYFLRAINCGAIDPSEATSRTGLTLDEIQTRSFLAILEGRTGL
ncbi:MAG TPA: phosphoenolpyruvate kinase [Acidimicrobiia bacterium]|nr:phosphoenolpyruvate kinase [Acidimicrobiia bacterium]